MSQKNGISPQSSIGSSPQPSITQATTSNSHPPPSILKHSPPDTRVSPGLSSNSKQSSASVSKQVHIPRLSPATTELLARVTGGRTGGSNNMRVSSAFIDLPIPPFASKTPLDAPRRTATPQQEDVSQPAGLVDISPKPVEEQPNSAPQTQAQIQSRATSPPSSTAKWHELPSIRPTPSKEDSAEPEGLAHTSPKAAEMSSTSISQTQSQSQPQATSSASPIVERGEVPDSTPTPSEEKNSGPSELAHTSPKPIETQSISDPQVQTQSQSQATSSTSTAEQIPTVPSSTSEGNNLEQDSEPVGTSPTSLPQIQQPQLQDTTPIAQSTSSAITAGRPERPTNLPTLPTSDNTGTTGPVPIAPKPVETPAPVSQVQPQIQATAQTVPSAAFTAEQHTSSISPVGPIGGNLGPSTLVPIAPRPAEGPASLPQIQPHLQDAAHITQAATSKPPLAPPIKASPASRQRKSTTNAKRGKKRKRGDDSDNEVIRAGDSSSDESDVAPTATQTKSGRQVNRPSLYVPPTATPVVSKGTGNSPNASNSMAAPATSARKRRRPIRKGKDINVSCVHCQRGHSPFTNIIVFCDECNRAWHQLCHDPPIDNEVVTVQEKEWRCRGCKPVPLRITFPTVVRSNPTLQSRPLGPPAHPPLPVSQIEVGGERYSKDERRSYLSSLSHSTLVELLVTLSDHNPSVPMFPANLRSLPTSRFVCQPNIQTVPPPPDSAANSTTSGSTVQPANSSSSEQETNQTRVNPAPNPMPAPAARRGRYEESSDESEYEEVEDHRLYPRAGNGFRLSLNPSDLDILQEDPACPTFSYALHGPAKARAEANEAAPVWGAA